MIRDSPTEKRGCGAGYARKEGLSTAIKRKGGAIQAPDGNLWFTELNANKVGRLGDGRGRDLRRSALSAGSVSGRAGAAGTRSGRE
jgi:hypothetical protein